MRLRGAAAAAGAGAAWSWPLWASVVLGGVGVQLPLNTAFGAVGYLSLRFGSNSFVWVNLAAFVPLAGTALWQLRSAERSPQLQNQRLVAAYWVSAAALALAPAVEDAGGLGALLVVVGLLGALSAFQFGALFAVVMKVPSRGTLDTGLSLGVQASALVALAAQVLATYAASSTVLSTRVEPGAYNADGAGLQPVSLDSVPAALAEGSHRASHVAACYLGAVATGLSSLSVRRLLRDPLVANSINNQASGDGRWDQKWGPVADQTSDCDDHDDKQPRQRPATSLWTSSRPVRSQALALFFNVFGSVFLFPFYALVESETPGPDAQAQLAVTLVYARALSDTLVRPFLSMSLCETAPSGFWEGAAAARMLLVATAARLALFGPFVLWYVFGRPATAVRSDAVIVGAVALFSAASGALVTVSYQQAAVARGALSAADAAAASKLLTVAFQLGVLLATPCAMVFLQVTQPAEGE